MSSLSIITINYNNRQGLEKTIESVLNQTSNDFEFIIIDGDSNDGSRQLIEENAEHFSYWVSEADTGIYNAMNKGIRKSTGDYLLFLNSGDTLHQKNTLFQAKKAMIGSADIYYGDIIYVENDVKTRRSFPNELTFSFFLEHSISHQASFIKRSLFEDVFYYNEQYSIISDWEFFIYAICKLNVRTHHLDQIISNYDTEGLSSDINNHPKMHHERNMVIEEYFSAFKEDYKDIGFLQSKRGKQLLIIKKHSFTWKLLKGFISILLIFLPKNKN
ncbi:glycosyltransferase family 2 protein [Pedobacter sp. PWIIR3]